MSTSRRMILVVLAIAAVAAHVHAAAPTIDSMAVAPADPAIGWGTPFTVTVTVSGGTPPYAYSWTQIGGTLITISGEDTDTIAGTTPTRVENLTTRDRDVWQVTGWSESDVSLEFWCVVTDSSLETAADSVTVTMTRFSSIGEGFVGLGTEVVLNGSDQALYDWSLTTVPSGSSALFRDGSEATQAPYFVPDIAGTYVATETHSGETVTVYADLWKGVGTIDGASPTLWQCAGCHASETTNWEGTGHSVTYSEHIYSRLGGDPKYACNWCHTVGFNSRVFAVNDGYDDMVDTYMPTDTTEPYDCGRDGVCPSDPGYPAPDSDGSEGDGLPDLPADFTDLPDEVKSRTSVQCESCHGPFVALHFDGDTQSPAGHLSWETSVCGACHTQETEWLESGHTEHVPPDAAVRVGCVKCHAGDFFVDIQIDGNEQPAVPPASGEHIVCATCHDPHEYSDRDGNIDTAEYQLRAWGSATLPDGTVMSDIGSGAICIMCHSGRRTPSEMNSFITYGSSYLGPHQGPQGSMMAGVMGYEYPGEVYANSFHATGVENQCVS